MMTKISLIAIVILIALQGNLSCKKETSCEGCKENNKPPIAIAGPDQVITLPTDSALLDGSSSSDPDGTISVWLWTKISGPASFNLDRSLDSITTVKNLAIGTYHFELSITDQEGLFSKDTTQLIVRHLATVCDSVTTRWTLLQHLPADEFFFAPRFWFNGDNFLMGIDNMVFAVSNKGRVWQYSTQSDSWQMTGTFPENMAAMPVVFSINGSGYCIGNGNCWQFFPGGQWISKNDPPGNVHAPLSINGKVYLMNDSNEIVEYDPVSDSYAIKNNCPSTDALIGSFVIGGYGFHVYKNGQCWKYNAANDTWQQKASLSFTGNLNNTCSFSLNSFGHIIGDLNDQAIISNSPITVFRYNSLSDSWAQCPKDNFYGDGVYGLSVVTFNGVVYAGLGYNVGDFNAVDFWKFQ